MSKSQIVLHVASFSCLDLSADYTHTKNVSNRCLLNAYYGVGPVLDDDATLRSKHDICYLLILYLLVIGDLTL